MTQYILSIDQGTTSSRAIIFDKATEVIGTHQLEFTQHFPHEGWVEHDPMQIWQTTLDACIGAIQNARIKARDITSIGITNQRETIVVWERKSGKPIYNAIVWQDRRTSKQCEAYRSKGLEQQVSNKTGLLLDPYFSATKIAWILDNTPGAREQAERGELCAGTIDTWLIWQLTGGLSHKTDASNASRTSLFNIHQQCWDDELLALFNVPKRILPEVCDNVAYFGETQSRLFGTHIPIWGSAGDQQSALIGQGAIDKGDIKSTYGTGCFVILNTGDHVKVSKNRLLSTVAYRINGKTTYGLEGSIFIAGAGVQWLRDQLKIIRSAPDSEYALSQCRVDHGVYLVPAFTGLGAPHWNAEARGIITGLTRDSGAAELTSATIQSVAYQTRDLFVAMASDGINPKAVAIDGGMVANRWLCQFLSDILDTKIRVPVITETTALGAAALAGIGAGVYTDLSDFKAKIKLREQFSPKMDTQLRAKLISGWEDAIKTALFDASLRTH